MPSTTKGKSPWGLALLVLGILLLDQGTKALVRQTMDLFQSIPVLDNVFHLTYIENKGAAFGAFSGATSLLTLVSIIFIVGLWFAFMKMPRRPKGSLTALALISGGGVGNLIDRLWRGSVTDMFDFRIWPIFNVADIAVTLGVLALMILVLRHDDAADT